MEKVGINAGSFILRILRAKSSNPKSSLILLESSAILRLDFSEIDCSPSAPTGGIGAVVFSFVSCISFASGDLETVELLLKVLGGAFSSYG